jgi:hypothetical protein
MADDIKQIAMELLRLINAPLGMANILPRRSDQGFILVVRLAPGTRIPKERLPKEFKGVPVVYERRESIRPIVAMR